MSDMSPEPQHAAPPDTRWTAPQSMFAVLLGLVSLCIVGPAFYAIYKTATTLVRPYLHGQSWIVPTVAEVAFTALFGWGILLAWRKKPDVPIRVFGMGIIVILSVAIQGYAGRGSFPDAAAHLVIVGSFFIVTLTVKAAVTSLRGGKVRPDRMTAGEFLASPARAIRLWRWMRVWGESSRTTARHRYMVLLYAIDVAQSDERVGKRPFRWRRSLPVTLRYDLATGDFGPEVAASGDDWKRAVREHVRLQLAAPPDDTAQDTPEVIPAVTAEAPAASPAPSAGQQSAGQPHGSGDGTREGSDWPQTKDVNKAVLARRVKAACERWERAHDGQRLPATQLGAELKVRMSRETATALLKTAYSEQGSPQRIGAIR